MKNEVLKKFEEINEARKISKDLREKLLKIIFENLLIAISVMILMLSLTFTQSVCNKEMVVTIYKMASAVLLLAAVLVIERAYKRDNGRQALQGIELLVIGMIVLFANHIIIKGNIFTKLAGVYIAVYYIIKTFVMYRNSKKKYLQKITDIKEIVKKENKDKIKAEKDSQKQEKNKIKAEKDSTKQEKTTKTKAEEKSQKAEQEIEKIKNDTKKMTTKNHSEKTSTAKEKVAIKEKNKKENESKKQIEVKAKTPKKKEPVAKVEKKSTASTSKKKEPVAKVEKKSTASTSKKKEPVVKAEKESKASTPKKKEPVAKVEKKTTTSTTKKKTTPKKAKQPNKITTKKNIKKE